MGTKRQILHGLLLIAAMTLLAWLLGDQLDRHWIDVYVRGRGLTGELLLLGVTTLLISIGLSRQLVAFLAGYSFGFIDGFLLSMLAVVAGCVITFYCTRLLLREWLLQHFSARIHRLDAFIREHTFTATLLFRLMPVGSNWMVNIAAGMSAVRSVPFFLGSALGYVPQMAIFSLVGSGAQLQQFWQAAVAMTLFVIATLLGVWLFARYRRYYRTDTQPGTDMQDSFIARKQSSANG